MYIIFQATNQPLILSINHFHGIDKLANRSNAETTKILVQQGKFYLLCIVNAAVNNHLFFKIASHNLTTVAIDASYTKPYTTDIMLISPGQTADILLTTNEAISKYYIAANGYTTQARLFDNTTTTAIIDYVGSHSSATPSLPRFPVYNDTAMVTKFNKGLRSLASPQHPIEVPQTVDKKLLITIGLGLFPCRTRNTTNCQVPNNTRIMASMNNVSFFMPDIAILQAYYFGINGVFTTNFPSNPLVVFNYTSDNVPKSLWAPTTATKIKVLNYNATIQVVFQAMNIFQPNSHPMHIHGYDFYVVGEGFGNYYSMFFCPTMLELCHAKT